MDAERDYIARTIATVRNHRESENCWPQWANIFADEIERLRAELQAAQERLELIARNAESWHHDADARQRALNVIAAWARGGEIPESLLRNLRGQRTEEPSDG